MKFTTAQEKKEAFHKELKQLLVKYDAELAIQDFAPSNSYGSDEKIVVEFGWDQKLCDLTESGIIDDLCLGSHESGRE